MTNWDNARFFLAVARAGTLRGAAAQLKVDQATVGRRIVVLEEALSARLFLRTPSMLLLTAAGEALLGMAETMEQTAHSIERRIAGLDEQIAGTIRVATTDSLGTRFLLPAIRRVRRQHPGINVVCVTSMQIANLTRREADLAIRTLRPEAPDLIVKQLARLDMGLYASREYLDVRGMPREGDAFTGHDLLIYHRSVAHSACETLCGEPMARGRVVFQASSTTMLVEAASAGLGIAGLPTYLAGDRPELVPIMPSRCDDFEVWLVAHADLYKTARMQLLITAIAEEFAAYQRSLLGDRDRQGMP